MMKLKAIWGILTSKCWFVATSETGKDYVTIAGFYTYGMAETIISHTVGILDEYDKQQDAVDQVKNIINGTL